MVRKSKTVFIYVVSFLLHGGLFGLPNAVRTDFKDALGELLRQYQRPYTVLEIGNQKPFISFNFLRNQNATFVLMPVRGHEEIAHNIQKYNHTNIVLLAPKKIDTALITRLGRCEYPDVTIVRDLPELKNFSAHFIKACASLGDFLCVQSNANCIESLCASYENAIQAYNIKTEQPFCIIKTPKEGLDIARWNQNKKPTLATPRYKVVSNFTEKKMVKLAATTEYVRGINLLTCVMLHGLYPTDEIIRKNIAPLTNLNHEDLVVGNFVVQGKKLVPIDFNDRRRKGDPQRCVKAALYFFHHDRRFKDVQKALRKYESKVQNKHKKKKASF